MINIVYGIVFSFLTDDFAVLSFYISPNQLKIGTRTVSYLKDELGALSLHMYSDTYSQLRGETQFPLLFVYLLFPIKFCFIIE